MRSPSASPIRMTIAVLISIWILAGCTSSGSDPASDPGASPSASDSQGQDVGGVLVPSDNGGAQVGEGVNDQPDAVVADPIVPDTAPSDPLVPDTVAPGAVGSDPVVPVPVDPGPVVPDPQVPVPVVPDPVVPDPAVQNTTRVDFDITVPAYQSNALQVRVIWADKVMTAGWVGDEYWSLSDTFPTNTEHPLLVEFNDGNGSITLGSIETVYKTGTNAAETYQITADQFDTIRWDNDGDGISNLRELSTGRDPLVDEAALLDVRDPYDRPSALWLLTFNSDGYEGRVPAERPYFNHTEEVSSTDYLTDRKTQTITIDIDASGTGSFSDDYMFREARDRDVTTEKRDGTRTRTQDSVIWMGTYYRLNNSAYRGENVNFTIETKAVDAQTLSQTGTVASRPIGGYDSSVDVSYALTGTTIENSPMCLPVAGTIDLVEYAASINRSSVVLKTSYSKEIDDSYWLVNRSIVDGDTLEEFYVRAVDITFYCDFADL